MTILNPSTNQNFEVFRSSFPAFYDAVKNAHHNAVHPHEGHGLDHDVTVAMLSYVIAPDRMVGTEAACAAMLHSHDRFFGRWSNDVQKAEIATQTGELIRKHASLLKSNFTEDRLEAIAQAAIRHSELNKDDQLLTQWVLMDADRLANLMQAVIIRAGQFRPQVPAFQFEYLSEVNPASTYAKPCSILDDLRNNVSEYTPQFRLPKAIKMAQCYTIRLQGFMVVLEQEYAELGLIGVML